MSHSLRLNRGRTIAFLAILLLGLFVLGNVLFPSYEGGDDTKTNQAQLGCQVLETAIEAFAHSEANTKHDLPTTPSDLVNPPFGGQSFLRNGEADLLDPWGKPYEMERQRYPDGHEYILVKTTAPNGTPISQFGIGRKNAVPPCSR